MISDDRTKRSTMPGPHGAAAALTATSVYAILATGILGWFEGLPPAVRIPLALPLLLYAPGYAVVTALVPPSGRGVPDTEPDDSHLSTLERGLLSVVISVAIVPMVAAVANYLMGIDYVVVLVGVAGITVAASVVAFARLPASSSIGPAEAPQRSGPLRGDWITIVRDTLRSGTNLLALTIVVVLLVASASVSFAGGADDALETEFYLANSTETPGRPTASGTATAFDLRIDHHGPGAQRFTVVVLRDEGTANPSWSEVTRTSTVVPPDETAAQEVRLDSSGWGANTTVKFLLYHGEAEQTPDSGAAHRALKVTLNEPA